MNRKEIREKIAALALKQAEVAEQYPDYDIPSEVMEEVRARDKEIKDLKAQWDGQGAGKALLAAGLEAHKHFNQPAGEPEAPVGEQIYAEVGPYLHRSGLRSAKSLGDLVTGDKAFKEWLAGVAPHGNIPTGLHITSPGVDIGPMLPAMAAAKALVTGLSQTSGGAMVWPDVRTGLIDLPFRPLVMRDIVTAGQTGSDTVEYARVTSYTNAAAAVAEATNVSTGTKPESSLALEKVTATVRTIAHWIPATKRALADAGQLRTLIDNFLLQGLDQAAEDEMVTGDGTGEHFTGIANISGTQSQAWDTDILTTTRKARTLVRTVGRDVPNAFLFHPTDWQTIDLLQDNEARYYMGGPREILTPRLWGLPVVEAEAVPQGTGYVGNFRQCVLWDREQGNIQVSDSHSDFFVKNLVAILAEMRAAFGCLRPASIVEIDLTA